MKKVFFTPIGGKFYPLVYTYSAKMELLEHVEELAEFKNIVSKGIKNLPIEEQAIVAQRCATIAVELADIFIRSGCAYKNCMEPNASSRPNDAVDENGVWRAINKEDILTVIENEELSRLIKVVVDCLDTENGSIAVQVKNHKKKLHQKQNLN